jgi:hypothetical protein
MNRRSFIGAALTAFVPVPPIAAPLEILAAGRASEWAGSATQVDPREGRHSLLFADVVERLVFAAWLQLELGLAVDRSLTRTLLGVEIRGTVKV